MNLCSNAEDGFIRILNSGEFHVYYELRYSIAGFGYGKESREFNNGETVRLNIPGGATDIEIDVFISNVSGFWLRSFELRYEIPADYCFEVSGVFASPSIERVPCNTLGEFFNYSCKRLC